MKESKLIALLRALDAREIRRLDDYLRSPFFQCGPDTLALWQVLLPLAPRFADEDTDRHDVFARAFPGRPLPTDAEMARQMSALLQRAEDFLGTEALLARPGMVPLHATPTLAARGLWKHHLTLVKRCERIAASATLRDQEWHAYQQQLAGNSSLMVQARHDQAGAEHLHAMRLHLDAYYLIQRLSIAHEMVNRKLIIGSSDASDLDPVWALLEGSPARQDPAVQIHAVALRMVVEPDEPGHFHELRSLTRTHGHILEHQRRQFILTQSQNHCIRRIRAGEAAYLRELFLLYQDADREGILLDAGEISPWKYKNIASVGLQLGEYAWVEAFVHQFQPYLPAAFRDNAFAYNLADLQYHRREYSKALRTLLQVEFTDLVYALDTRKLQLKVYYEQGDTEPMLSLMHAFRTFLGRQKLLAEETRRAYLNFISLLHTIWKAGMDGQTQGLIAEIESTQPIVEEAWLRKVALDA